MGLGMVLAEDEQGGLVVDELQPGKGAAQSGNVLPGDQLMYACGQCPASGAGMIGVLLRERHLSHLEQRCRTSSDKSCARGRIEPAIGCYCGEGASRPSHDHTYWHVAMRETPLKDRASLL